MRRPRTTSLRTRGGALAAVVVACLAMAVVSLPTMAASTTASTVVTVQVPSATSLDVATGCAVSTPNVTDFGQLQPGTNNVTPSDCLVTFGSSNDTSMLKAYQTDGSGTTMTLPPDALDTAFDGPNGYTEVTAGPCAISTRGFDRLKVQPDGKILGVGECTAPATGMLARFNAAGGLDLTFGAPNGYVLGDFLAGNDSFAELEIEPDGDILVTGRSHNGVDWDLVVARYDSVGVLDTAGFANPNGFAVLDLGDDERGTGVGIEADGDVVVGGQKDGAGVGDDALVVRYDAAGALDTAGFANPNGYNSFDNGNDEQIIDLVVEPSGRIILGGRSQTPFYQPLWVAFDSAGALDTATFNSPNGFKTITLPGPSTDIERMQRRPTGELVLIGQAQATWELAVAQVTSTGATDVTFGAPNGYVLHPAPGPFTFMRGQAGYLDVTGHLMVVSDANPPNAALIHRLEIDGAIDTTFGGGDGWIDTNTGMTTESIVRQGASFVIGGDVGPTINTAAVMRFAGAEVPDFNDDPADLAGDDWGTPGAAQFGVCLRSVGLGSSTDGSTWTEDGDNDCTVSDADPWMAIPALSTDPNAKVVQSTVSGTVGAEARLQFGFRAATDQKPGLYAAPITFEAVAPNV